MSPTKKPLEDKPLSEYGSEQDDWDVTSFKKDEPIVEQEDIENVTQVAEKQVRKELFLQFFKHSL